MDWYTFLFTVTGMMLRIVMVVFWWWRTCRIWYNCVSSITNLKYFWKEKFHLRLDWVILKCLVYLFDALSQLEREKKNSNNEYTHRSLSVVCISIFNRNKFASLPERKRLIFIDKILFRSFFLFQNVHFLLRICYVSYVSFIDRLIEFDWNILKIALAHKAK